MLIPIIFTAIALIWLGCLVMAARERQWFEVFLLVIIGIVMVLAFGQLFASMTLEDWQSGALCVFL